MLTGKVEEIHHHRRNLDHGTEKNWHDLTTSCYTSSTPDLGPSTENANVVTSEETDNFLCSFCDRKFQNKSRRDRHENRHVLPVAPRIQCCKANCGKLFATKATLNKHKRYVRCLSLTTPRGSLNRFQVHERTDQFPCNKCKKVFYRSDHLQQ